MKTVVLKATDGIIYMGDTEFAIGTEEITLKNVCIKNHTDQNIKNELDYAKETSYLGKITFNKQQIVWYYSEEKKI